MAILQRVAGSSSVIDPGIGSVIVLVDTANASWTARDTIYLPAAPRTLCQVTIKDATGSADTKPITIGFAGQVADGGMWEPTQESAVTGWLSVANATVTDSGVSSLPDGIAGGAAISILNGRRPPRVTSANGFPLIANNLATNMTLSRNAGNSQLVTWGFAAHVALDDLTLIHTLIRYGTSGSSSRVNDSHRLIVLADEAIQIEVHVDATGSNYRIAKTAAGVLAGAPKFITVEFNGAGATEADIITITVDTVVQPLTFSAVGTAPSMPTALQNTPPGIILFNTRSNTSFLPLVGRIGPNILFLGSKMAGATEGLLTSEARMSMSNYQRPTDALGLPSLEIPYGSRTCIFTGSGWCFI